jgi:uncharacterized protein YkwD
MSAAAQAAGTSHHKHAHACKRTHRKHKSRCAHKTRKHTSKLVAPAAPVHVFSVQAAASDTSNNPGALSANNASSEVNLQQLLEVPCQNTQLTPGAANLPLIREATLCLVNQERARNGEQPLRTNSDLEQSAEGHSQDMVAENYFAHVAPNGLGPAERVQETGYVPNAEVGWTIGENIAWATGSLDTPQKIVEAWIASPEHLANILESKFRDSGIGVDPQVPSSLAEGQAGAIYTQDFGVIEN